ncbi:alpha/beta hydrolase [Ornithinibacillus sp. FSL M8-0202]|uniref:alpha/beta hydrolase n=1 Tax=Ornithinibacillus sp. FSL M8-0202 TaxID=2921616 RepID=UPI0030D12EB5
MNPALMFIHSAGPQGENQGSYNLIKYVHNRLGNNAEVISPKMPTPEDPKYSDWKNELDKALAKHSGGIVLVGHSLGGSVLLKYFSEEVYHVKVLGLFIVAAPFWGKDDDWQRKDFFLQETFEQHLKEIPHIFLYHSRDEEIVPLSHHSVLAEKLPQSTCRILDGSDHLFENGLPELVRDIRRLLR